MFKKNWKRGIAYVGHVFLENVVIHDNFTLEKPSRYNSEIGLGVIIQEERDGEIEVKINMGKQQPRHLWVH